MKKLAIVTTHPIQYNAPFFKELSRYAAVVVKVFYTWSQTESGSKYDPNFQLNIDWNIPLLEGYDYKFVKNISKNPGSNHFWGINNPGLIKEISEFKPDAILFYGWNFTSHLRAIFHFKGRVPVWFRGDSTLIDTYGSHWLKKLVRKIILRIVYSCIDKAFYVGSKNKSYFLEYGLKASQLVYAPHSIDNERFEKESKLSIEKAESVRLKLGINASSKVILFAGKIESKKNPALLIDAFLNINPKTIHLIFVGDGPLKNELINRSNNQSNIHWHGFVNQSEMPLMYQVADILILPSSGPGETWGLCLNEAMACSKPVIGSTACGGSFDLIDEGETGWMLEKGSIDQLEKMLIALDQMSRISLVSMGRKANEKISTFNFQSFCKSILENL